MNNQATHLNLETIPVIINRYAGTAQTVNDLEALFNAVNLSVKIYRPEPKQLAGLLQQLREDKAPMIVVGGGDGTLSTAANVLVDSDIILGILPLGTFNHFAKDLGLPLTLTEAVQVLAKGRVQRIDVGDINGHVFINNASLGFYPYAVQQREQQRQELNISKLPAMTYALLKAWWQLPTFKALLRTDARQHHIKTPFLFLGNNRYEPELLADRQRTGTTHITATCAHPSSSSASRRTSTY